MEWKGKGIERNCYGKERTAFDNKDASTKPVGERDGTGRTAVAFNGGWGWRGESADKLHMDMVMVL